MRHNADKRQRGAEGKDTHRKRVRRNKGAETWGATRGRTEADRSRGREE